MHSKRKRGRRYNPNSKRNQTTRAGRRGERDRGSDQLRLQRLALTGSEELPVDPLGVLFGRKLISTAQYNAGREIGELLEVVRRGLVGNAGSVQGSWLAILSGGAIRGHAELRISAAATFAIRVLDKLRERIANQAIVVITFAVCAGEWRPCALNAMVRIRSRDGRREFRLLTAGLDVVARSWSRNRDNSN